MFINRQDAGRQLAQQLKAVRGSDVVVLGLPRGGLPVGQEVADLLAAPLDVIVVRKLPVPGQPELAMGAVGEDDVRVLNDDVLEHFSVSDEVLESVTEREWQNVARRVSSYRKGRTRASLVGRTALIVDDGIATGATARAACQVARLYGAARVVLAVPVAPRGWTGEFAGIADECVAVDTPRRFMAVGAHYRDFDSTTDDEVVECLRRNLRK